MTPRRSVQRVTQGGIEWWQHTMNRMVQCRTIPALLDLAYDAIRGGLGYEHVGVFLVDPTRHALVELVTTDEEGHKAHPPTRAMPPEASPDTSLLSDPRMSAEGPGFVFQAGAEEEERATAGYVPNGQLAPTLYVALRTPEAVIGLLTVTNLDGKPGVTPADAPPLVALATALAPAVHNIALREDPAAHTSALREDRAHHVGEARRPDTPVATPPVEPVGRVDALPAGPTGAADALLAGPVVDPTRLIERETLLDHLDRTVDEAGPFALLLLTIDNVSLFKDTHGAAAGDRVLHSIAMMLRHICRDVDVVARYSADDIAVVLQGVIENEARATLRRLQRMVAARPHIAPDGAAIPVVLTVGLACYPTDGHTRRDLVTTAEAALLAAHGRRARQEQPHVVTDLLNGRDAGVLTALIAAIDAKDHYTREHSEDVTHWALRLAVEIGVDVEQRQALALAAVLHDIGKVAVPDRVLRKPGKLTREEYEIMRHHVSFGVAIIRGVVDDPMVLGAVAHHHERWDGQGYPDGLSGDQTSLLGRVMQIADAVSAMRLDRPYRQGLPWARVTAELCDGAGKQFDPALVDLFVRATGQSHA